MCDIRSYIRQATIIALDKPTSKENKQLAGLLGEHVGYFKTGIGSDRDESSSDLLPQWLKDAGYNVFYDHKYTDIGNTLLNASKAVSLRGWDMFNVMLNSSRASIQAAVAKKGNVLLFGVTVPTDINDEECIEIYGATRNIKVREFAQKGLEERIDGIICAVSDLQHLPIEIRNTLLTLTPGIRMEGGNTHDQKMIATPQQAIRAGADFFVLGRSVTDSIDPLAALLSIQEEMTREMSTIVQKGGYIKMGRSRIHKNRS